VSSVDASDEARFAALYVRNHGQVLAYCARRVGPDQARDAVSDTFLVAWRRLGDIPEAELPWLLRTASLVLRDHARAQRRQDRTVARAASALPATVGDHAAEVADATDAERALAGLSEADRELLMLSAWDDLSPAQIAAVLGCSPAAARVRLHRARRRLAGQLANPTGHLTQPVHVPTPQEQR
jgi:RNA polymerase sigma-70 factor (ECF subfamily)